MDPTTPVDCRQLRYPVLLRDEPYTLHDSYIPTDLRSDVWRYRRGSPLPRLRILPAIRQEEEDQGLRDRPDLRQRC